MKLKQLRPFLAITMDNIAEHLRDIKKLSMGNVSFGATNDDKSADRNIECSKASGTSPAANTEFAVTHSLKRVPLTFFGHTDNGGVLYKSTTAWNKTQIFLKCTTATANYQVFIV
jgi:hypothetical protein